jgi:two-component system CheB/CheR fusion protein
MTLPDRSRPTRRTGLRVLVVADDAGMGQSTARWLQCNGHDARVAADGPTALRLAADDAPDVVLLDLGLPGMDGCEVARRLREQCATRRPLIIAVTGCTQAEVPRRCDEAGVDLYLRKPADSEALRALLAGLAARRGTGCGRVVRPAGCLAMQAPGVRPGGFYNRLQPRGRWERGN